MTGSAGQKRVPKEYFAESKFPFPPLKEQKRIVSKVDQLMVLCDGLAERLEEADSKRDKLFQAVVNQVLEFKNKG